MKKRWRIQQTGPESWDVINPKGDVVGQHGNGFKVGFLQALAQLGQEAREELAEASEASAGRFRAEMVPEGISTSDGRQFDKGAAYWRDPPLPLMLQTETEIGHFGAELCGRIDKVSRDGDMVVSEGDLDDIESGRDAAAILTQHGRFGLSVDLGAMEADFVCEEFDDDGWCESGTLFVHEGEIIGATMTPFPAFAEAFIELTGEGTSSSEDAEGDDAQAAAAPAPTPIPIRASAFPVVPPADWLNDPELDGPTAMTIQDDGRLYGHAALWGECHIGMPEACTVAPHSQTDYAYYRVGALKVEDCECDQLAVGKITMGTGHADLGLDYLTAAAHYDNTGTAVADVACGEDDFGIWFSGALRPNVTPEQVRELRASAISGDWRPVGGGLEMVAMLAVNVPGYPVPRARVASGGEVRALVAAGGRPLAHRQNPLEARIAAMETELRRLSRIADPLRPQAAAAVARRVTQGAAQ